MKTGSRTHDSRPGRRESGAGEISEEIMDKKFPTLLTDSKAETRKGREPEAR